LNLEQGAPHNDPQEENTDWLSLARSCFQASTDYMDTNYRKGWEDNLRAFGNKHPSDSKYNSENYRHRSRIFRPKTRSVIRRNEAAAAAAFFSNPEVIDTQPINKSDMKARAAAEIMKELVQYRLTKTIPWFLTCIGALQDAQTVGVCCSYQYWKYDEADGKPLEDEPCIELIPVENIRIDPGASWIDPIGTSPFVIRMIPMYRVDVEEMRKRVDPKTGQPKWKKEQEEERGGEAFRYDTTRMARESLREDSKNNNANISDYDILWVHENFVKRDGKTWVYFTLATEELLTDPKELSEVYFHGEIPIVMGFCIIETHKVYPAGIAELIRPLQAEANEIANQRLDNVKFVLNKKWIAKRNSQVDLNAIVRNVPGGVILASNPETDLKEVNFPDVTASSYAEQDRINADMDDLAGNFSPGSAQTKKGGPEPVRNNMMFVQGAGQMTEYMLRIFIETWVKKVLRQLVKLEQAYETDRTVLAIAAQKAQLHIKYGMSEVTNDILDQELLLEVNVGMSATDPFAKLQKFLTATNSIAGILGVPTLPPTFKMEATKEIFGLLGYGDGKRFMGEQQADPEKEHLMQVIQQLQETIKMDKIKAEKDILISREQIQKDLAIAHEKHAIAKESILRDHLKHSQEQHTKRNDTAAKVLIADHASQHQSRLEDKKLNHDKSKPKEQPKTESKSPVNVKVDLHIDNQKGKVTKHIEFNGKTGTVVEEAR
jgi:hypothetical protein